MVPRQPGEVPAVRREARRGIEIAAVDQDMARPRRGEVDRNNRIVDTLVGMGLAHADPPVAGGVDDTVGIAPARTVAGLGGQRLRAAAGRKAVKALVGEIAEIDDTLTHRHRAAAIFVDAGANIVGRRRDVAAVLLHQHIAATLARPAFGPIDVGAVDNDAAEPDRLGDDQIRGDRRAPRAVG